MHSHLLWNVGGVGGYMIKGSFHNQAIQYHIAIWEPTGLVFDLVCCLHMHVEEEVPEE